MIILDDDLISFLGCKTSEGTATLFGTWISWLVKQFKDMINERVQQIPMKSRKVMPFVYWLTAPIHSYFSKERNSLRLKFNLSLESVVKQETNMRVIKLKEFWDSKDSQLVINDRITEVGMAAYWNAMDASVKFNILHREQYVTKQLVSKPAAVPASSVSVPPNSLNPTER